MQIKRMFNVKPFEYLLCLNFFFFFIFPQQGKIQNYVVWRGKKRLCLKKKKELIFLGFDLLLIFLSFFFFFCFVLMLGKSAIGNRLGLDLFGCLCCVNIEILHLLEESRPIFPGH